MARAMQNFRKFLKGSLDALTDETKAAANQIARASKAGSAAHFTVELVLGLEGQVEEDSTGGFDFKLKTAAALPVAGGAVAPELGWSSGMAGRFLGPGQAQLTCRMVLVNATALEEGVDATNPGDGS